MKKTAVVRLLTGKKIKHRAFSYAPDTTDSTQVAKQLGIPPQQVYKTLVAYETHKKRFLVMIPSSSQLDLKKLARAVQAKKVRLATHREAEDWTKLKVGGISALALLNRGFKILLDSQAQALEHVIISGGERGTNVQLRVEDLLRLTNARFADVVALGAGQDFE